MTLEELKKIVYKELPINKDHLDTEALRGQELYAKFLDYKTNYNTIKYFKPTYKNNNLLVIVL